MSIPPILVSVYAYLAAHYMNSGPLSEDKNIRALMAKTLVLGADAREDWINTAGIYWITNSTWRNLVGAHPSMDQYQVASPTLSFCHLLKR